MLFIGYFQIFSMKMACNISYEDFPHYLFLIHRFFPVYSYNLFRCLCNVIRMLSIVHVWFLELKTQKALLPVAIFQPGPWQLLEPWPRLPPGIDFVQIWMTLIKALVLGRIEPYRDTWHRISRWLLIPDIWILK